MMTTRVDLDRPLRLRSRRSKATVLSGLLFLLAGCAQAVEEPIVAVINGRPITQLEFDTGWQDLSPATRTRYEKEGGKKKYLDDLIMRELLMQEARRQGLDQSEEIRERTQRYKEQLILDELLKDRIKTKVEVSQEELQAYLDRHAGELLANPKVRVSLMLLGNVYAARDLKRQVESGGSFERYAQRYSIHQQTRENGGDVGPYRKGMLEPELEAVIPTLRAGAVSEPIETSEGFYLLRVGPLDKETLQADVATRERLRQELLAEKRRKRLDDVFSELRAHATIRLAEASRYVVDVASQSHTPSP